MNATEGGILAPAFPAGASEQERIAWAMAAMQERGERRADRPIDYYEPVPSSVAFHASSAKERWVVGGNRSSKSHSITAEGAALLSGGWLQADGTRSSWWNKAPHEVWFISVKQAKGVEVIRPKVRDFMAQGAIEYWRRETDDRSESWFRTRDGWIARFRACDQGEDAFKSGSCALAIFDEEPPAAIYDEVMARTVDCEGRVVIGFTPTQGIRWREAHQRVYMPWLEYVREHPGAKSGTVAEDLHVSTLSMRDNQHLPQAEVEKLIKRYEHRPLMLAVRVEGQWIDANEEAVIDATQLRTWTKEPNGGWQAKAVWIDPSYTAKDASCEASIAVAGIDIEGNRYLLESLAGVWTTTQLLEHASRVMALHGDPRTFVQRVGGDSMWAENLNRLLREQGRTRRVETYPRKGMVMGKVERANDFEPLVSGGEVYVREEHLKFKQQCAVFSASYAKGGGLLDAFDAGMGALTVVSECIGANIGASLERAYERAPRSAGGRTAWDGQSDREMSNLGGVD